MFYSTEGPGIAYLKSLKQTWEKVLWILVPVSLLWVAFRLSEYMNRPRWGPDLSVEQDPNHSSVAILLSHQIFMRALETSQTLAFPQIQRCTYTLRDPSLQGPQVKNPAPGSIHKNARLKLSQGVSTHIFHCRSPGEVKLHTSETRFLINYRIEKKRWGGK